MIEMNKRTLTHAFPTRK